MSQERIIVRLSVDGRIDAETVGMKGEKCLDSIALLEDLLEAQTLSSAFTPEYSETRQDNTIEGRNELGH